MADDNQALLLQISADLSKLEKQFDRANGVVDEGSGRMVRRAKKAANDLEDAFSEVDPGKALRKVFDSTRFSVLEEGSTKLRVFGSALEPLGPYGIAAAAGVVALAEALHGAREALEYTDQLSDTAKRLHVTTDAVQEFRYVIRAAGGEEKGADEALEAFSENLGKAQQGLVKGQRAFLALGFTKDQIKGFKDADSALTAVVEKIAGLGSNPQKDAIITQLGLDGVKPLVEDGVAEIQRLREEARRTGIVMDAELVRRGAELNDEAETLTKVIDVQLKSAFVDLGPVLLDLLKLLAGMARFAADIADAFKDIEHKSNSALDAQEKATAKHLDTLLKAQARGEGVSQLAIDSTRGELDRIHATQADRAREGAVAGGKPSGDKNLIDTSRHSPGPRDDTAQRVESVNAAVASANRDLLTAEQKLTDNIDARAEAESKIIGEELKASLARLRKQKNDIEADKGIADPVKRRLTAELDSAMTAERQAAEAKQALVKRQQDWANEDRVDETRKQVADAEMANLRHQSDIAKSSADRRRIQLQLLDIDQKERLHTAAKEISRQEETGAITDEEGNKRHQALLQQFKDEIDAVLRSTRGPLETFIDDTAEAGDQLQQFAVNGLEALNSGLVDAILNAHSLGDVARNVFRQIASDILNMLIRQNVTTPLAKIFAMIPGFAGGTDYAPGGLALVGEKGPELVKLPTGAQVIPNDVTRMLAGLQVGGRGAVYQTVNFDNRGAVLLEETVAKMQSYADQAAARAGAVGAQGGRILARQDIRARVRRAL